MTLLEKWQEFGLSFDSIFPELFGHKIQVRVVDTDRVIRSIKDYGSGISVEFKTGMKLPANSGPEIAMKQKQTIRRLVDKSHYGVELKTLNIPLPDDSGCISLVYNVDLEYQISGSLETIAASAQQITASSEEISVNAARMNSEFDKISEQIKITSGHSKKMLQVIEIVDEISRNLKVISINAMIEAAHAGDFGRGFSVVAQEVKNMAENTQLQVQNIQESIGTMLNKMTETNSMANGVQNEIKLQSISSQEIYKAIQSVTDSITMLKDSFSDLMNAR